MAFKEKLDVPFAWFLEAILCCCVLSYTKYNYNNVRSMYFSPSQLIKTLSVVFFFFFLILHLDGFLFDSLFVNLVMLSMSGAVCWPCLRYHLLTSWCWPWIRHMSGFTMWELLSVSMGRVSGRFSEPGVSNYCSLGPFKFSPLRGCPCGLLLSNSVKSYSLEIETYGSLPGCCKQGSKPACQMQMLAI